MVKDYHHVVMNQVRKNMLFELIRKAASDERYRHELFEFVAKEPLPVDNEVVDWILNYGMLSVGIGKSYRPSLDTSKVVRPLWRGRSLRAVLAYIREWPIYILSKIVCRCLTRVLVFLPENHAVLIYSAGSQYPGQRVGKS